MPIFSNFRATNVWKAFILNSILTSIVILVSITSKQYLDNYIDIDGDKLTINNEVIKIERCNNSNELLFTYKNELYSMEIN